IVAPGYLPERDVCWEVTDCAWVRAGSIAARPGAGARREGRDLRLPHGARPPGVRVRFPPTLLRRADLAVIMDTPPRAMPTGLSRGPATDRKSTRRAPSRGTRPVPIMLKCPGASHQTETLRDPRDASGQRSGQKAYRPSETKTARKLSLRAVFVSEGRYAF